MLLKIRNKEKLLKNNYPNILIYFKLNIFNKLFIF